MAKKLRRVGALTLVAMALTVAAQAKPTNTHGHQHGPKAPINSTTVDGGGRSFG